MNKIYGEIYCGEEGWRMCEWVKKKFMRGVEVRVWRTLKEASRVEAAFLSGKSILNGNFTRISS